MDALATPDLARFEPFLVSLAMGLLLGLEREGHVSARAGLRTFGLTAMFGCLAALLSARLNSPWPLVAGLGCVAAMMVVANWERPADDDPGTTTLVALLFCYGLGALAWHGETVLAAMLAIVAGLLLHLKAELRGIAARLSPRDLGSVLQFAALALILLPILPDRDLGPFNALNPRQIGLMIVLISGVSLAGYAALRLAGAEHGTLLAGILGGLVSSTATTLVFSRHARQQPALASAAIVVVLLANLTMFLRVSVLVTVMAPALLRLMAGPLLAGMAAAVLGALWHWRKLDSTNLPLPPSRNPTELPTALGFGLLYALILLASAALMQTGGERGLYAAAFIGGIPDIDATSLSSLRLLQLDKIGDAQAAIAITLAVIANLLLKTGLILTAGRWAVARRACPGMLLMIACVVLGLIPLL